MDKKDGLEEGLYKYENGQLERIQVSEKEKEGDQMRRLRVTQEAYEALIVIQKEMRKTMGGYKPDVSLVASAIIEHISKLENAPEIIKSQIQKIFA